jgi:serine/threonine protein phosphatase PrpC
VLWNVVGCGSDELSPAVYRADLQLNDTLLLCTNGLTGHLSDDDIAESLNANVDAKEACHRLVNAANQAGGTDNTTVVVARFRDLHDGLLVSEVEVGLDDVSGRDARPEVTTDNVPEIEPVREAPGAPPDSAV